METPEKLKNLREMADWQEERRKEVAINPLSQYSTTQLKAELRRRKKERGM